MIKRNILQLLNIRQEESWLARQLFLVQFFLVTGASFLLVIAYSAFLANYHIIELPKAYLISGVVLLAGVPLYASAEHRQDLPQLLKTAIVFCLLLTFLVWTGMQFTTWKFMPYVLFVWNNIVYMVSGLVFWGLAAILFNVRESKRLFTIIGAGDIPAKLLGYLAVSLLASLMGLKNMILLSFVSFLVAFLLAHSLFRSEKFSLLSAKQSAHLHEKHTRQHTHNQKKNPGTGLIASISWLSLLTFIVLILVDFIFVKEVKVKYHTDVQIAWFFGIFFASGRLLAIMLKITLSSRMMDKLGLTGSLILSPALLLTAAVFIICANGIGIGLKDFLYLFGALSLLTEILKSVIQEPVFLVLFQPLKLNLRLQGHLVAKGYMYALALILSGIFLIAYLHYLQDPYIIFFSYVLSGVILLWIGVIYVVKQQYVYTLHAALKSGFFRGNELFLGGGDTTSLLVKKASGTINAEAVFALDLLERSGYPSIDDLLERRLKSGEGPVEKYALERIMARGTVSALPSVEQVLNASADSGTRALCIRAIASLSLDPYDRLIPWLDSSDEACRRAAISGLLKSGDLSTTVLAGQRLLELVQSPLEEKRALAASIIGETEIKSFYRILPPLIDDESMPVQQAAIAAAGRIGNPVLLPLLIDKLKQGPLSRTVMTALAGYGDAALDYYKIMEEKQGRDAALLTSFISIAGNINSPVAMAFLLHYLQESGLWQKRIVDLLWEKGFAADPSVARQLQPLVGHTLEEALLAARYAEEVRERREAETLFRALVTEVELAVGSVFKLLSFIYDRHKINGAMNALLNRREDFKSSNAFEMLEMMLPKTVFRHLSRALDFIDHPELTQVRKIQRDRETMDKMLEDIIEGKRHQFNQWTRAVAIDLAGKIREPAVMGFLKERGDIDEPPIIRETIRFVLLPAKP